MITEDYCSYEVAKLLKEKGFDTFKPYGWDEKLFDKEHPRNFSLGFDNKEHWISCHTQSMAMKWLREVYNILLCIIPAQENGKLVYIVEVWTWNEEEGIYESTYVPIPRKKPEQAVETALKWCLENLI